MKFIKVRTNYFVTLINVEKIESVYEYTKNDREVKKPEQWLSIQTHDDRYYDVPNVSLEKFEYWLLSIPTNDCERIKIVDCTGDA